MAKLASEKISVSMVARAIGRASLDVGTLCTCDSVNKWSYCKPIHVPNVVVPLTDAQIAEAHYGLQYIKTMKEDYEKDNNYCYLGFYLHPLDYTDEIYLNVFTHKYELFGDGFGKVTTDGKFYGKPNGLLDITDTSGAVTSYTSPFRLSDFANYDHASGTPVYSVNGLEEVFTDEGAFNGYKLTLKVRRATSNYGGITVDNWTPYYEESTEKLSDWYFGVGVFTFVGGMQTMFLFNGGSSFDSDCLIQLNSTQDEYTFIMPESQWKILSDGVEWGYWSIVPFMVRQKDYRFVDMTNHITPIFNKNVGVNNIMFFDKCLWVVKQFNIKYFTLYGPTMINNTIAIGENGRYCTKLSYVPDDGVRYLSDVAYLNPVGNLDDYFQSGNVTELPEYTHYWGRLGYGLSTNKFELYTDKQFSEVIYTNKRTVKIGDYDVSKTCKFFGMPSTGTNGVPDNDYIYYRPLADVKVVYWTGQGWDMQLALRYEYVNSSNVNILLSLINGGHNGESDSQSYIDVMRLCTAGDTGNPPDLKTLLLQNILDGDGDVIGLRIKGISIDWSAYSNFSIVKDTDVLQADVLKLWYVDIKDTDINRLDNRFKYFYLPVGSIKDSPILTAIHDTETPPDGVDADEWEGSLLKRVNEENTTIGTVPYVFVSNHGVDDEIMNDSDVIMFPSPTDSNWIDVSSAEILHGGYIPVG